MQPLKYPAQAVAARIEGKVLVEAVVETDGSPGQLAVLESSGNTDLDQAALDSVAEWRFNAMQCDGKATRSTAVVPVEFALSSNSSEGSVGTLIPRSPGGAGYALAFDWRTDPQPLEFTSLKDGLQYLRSQPGISERRTPNGSRFTREDGALVWDLFETRDASSPAGPKQLILRQRWTDTLDARVLLIGAICLPTPTWCQQEINRRVADILNQGPP
ncbi:energy transducer TonB [Dokdonella sp.]|uniref:energy transducer TonB n=1 Tax=Dokdonella sp. TaxID=2291710 RepID=UPI0035275A7A